MNDQALVDEIVEAVRSGTATSRSEIAAVTGFSAGRTATLIGLAIRAKQLRLVGRDNRGSPRYAVVADQPSAVVAEVVC